MNHRERIEEIRLELKEAQKKLEESLSAYENKYGIIPKPGQSIDERIKACADDILRGNDNLYINHPKHYMYGIHKRPGLLIFTVLSLLSFIHSVTDETSFYHAGIGLWIVGITLGMFGILWLRIAIAWIQVWMNKTPSKPINADSNETLEDQRGTIFDPWQIKEYEKQKNCSHQWSYASPVLCIKCALSKEKFEQSKR